MQMKLTLVISLLSFMFSFAANAQQSTRVKDGRQYYLELARRLDVPLNVLGEVFNQQRANLPKKRDQESLASGIGSMTKLASAACDFASLINQDGTEITKIYQLILDREPTAEEKKLAIKNEGGQTSFFANCFVLALRPEFILFQGEK